MTECPYLRTDVAPDLLAPVGSDEPVLTDQFKDLVEAQNAVPLSQPLQPTSDSGS